MKEKLVGALTLGMAIASLIKEPGNLGLIGLLLGVYVMKNV